MKELHLLSILFLAVSSSLDNFGTGVSYGLRNICIPLSLNLIIASFNSSGTLFSMLFGTMLSGFLQPVTAGYIGASLLIGIGLWIIITEFRKKGPEMSPSSTPPEKPPAYRTGKPVVDKTFFSMIASILNDPFAAGILCTGKVTMKEGALLAAALTLTNLSTGIGAGMIGFNPAITTVAVFACSILAVSTGMKVGRYSSAILIKGIAGKAAGLLLLFIGFYELLR